MPEITAIRNSADSEALLLASVPNDSTILARPQIISTAEKSRYQISFYKTKPGDSASSVAAKFHISTNSVTASNNLSSDYVQVGTVLSIPPANGVVYQVKSGDTVSSIVAAYGADRSLFISVNDAEHGVYPGEHVWIPNVGSPQATAAAAPIADLSGSDFAFGSSAIYGYNGYDYGTCTWYVASHINVPSNWGNAYTWGPGARASGWTVSSTPRVGAIAWGDSYAGFGYLGHVAIVTAVSADGSQIKYSDMNDPYWNVVTNHGWAPVSTYTGYIYR
jgi:surface antigen